MKVFFGNYQIPVQITELAEGDFGEFSFYPYPSIKVSTGLKKEVETSTILHEVIEMISEVYGLSLEESQIRVLEVSLMGVFFQNPWLVERMFRPLHSQHNLITDFPDWPPSQALPDSPEAL